MSTRCVVQVDGAEAQFYHHCDGYPSGMLPLLEKARRIASRNSRDGIDAAFNPNKLGAILCAADPFGWHIEPASDRPDAGHGDLEYTYRIGAPYVGRPPGCRRPRLIWPVTVGDGEGRKIMGAILLGVPGEFSRFGLK